MEESVRKGLDSDWGQGSEEEKGGTAVVVIDKLLLHAASREQDIHCRMEGIKI